MNPKVAVVGAGYWGKNLVRNFYELGNLAAICDGNELLKPAFEEKYPGVGFEPNYDRMLKNDAIDAVVLATPAVTHYHMAKQALTAGKHVYVEKPLALEVRDAEELIALADQKSLVLMVGHILQYHSAVIKLKELIDSGALGKIQYLYSNRLNIGKIRTEENILWSFAPHDISVILLLLNETPDWLFSSGGNYLQEKIADSTLTVLNFPTGVKAHIFVSWLHPFKEQKLVVVGDKKMAVFDDTIDEKLRLYAHTVEWQNRVPIAAKADAEIVPIEKSEPLKNECRHFVTCITEGKKPRTDGREGLRVLKILNASQQSLDQAGAKIELGKEASKPASQTPPNQIASNQIATKKSDNVFVHESSYVDDGCTIGDGTRIWHFSHVMKGSTIGKNCRIGQNVVIGPNAAVGDGCKIQNNVSIYEGVTLGDFVFCGPSMVFTNVFNPRAEIPRMEELRTTIVKKGATFGANCTIVCGHSVGAYAFVGAGAVVTGEVPDFALMAGNPATIKGWMCQCGVRLNFVGQAAHCDICGTAYEKISDKEIAQIK